MNGLLRARVLLAIGLLGCAATISVSGCYGHPCEKTATCNVCPGECVRLPPLGFDGPALLWIGPEVQAPECPTRAPTPVYEGHVGLDDSNQCPACQCTEPACVFPSGVTASNQACPGGGILTPFETPVGWSGTCTSPGTVPANLLGSVTIAPVTVNPCQPIPPEVPQVGDMFSQWSTLAWACAGEAVDNMCGDPGMTCMPTAEPPPPGFRQCILYLREGEPQCPEDYSEKYTFYGGVEDTRACSPCACTETEASTCVASVSVYQDTACTTTLVGRILVGTSELPGPCTDVMAGVQLGSLAATWDTNQPGSCAASGGTPSGEVKPRDPSTFCCQPLLNAGP